MKVCLLSHLLTSCTIRLSIYTECLWPLNVSHTSVSLQTILIKIMERVYMDFVAELAALTGLMLLHVE